MAKPDYNPAVDGRPHPGEVVWTWVPYDEGSRAGKDRPVLVLAVEGARLTVLELRSHIGAIRSKGSQAATTTATAMPQ